MSLHELEMYLRTDCVLKHMQGKHPQSRHAGVRGSKGAGEKTMKVRGMNYVVGEHGTHSGHSDMSNQEKTDFNAYVDKVMASTGNRPVGKTPLHPIQFEKWIEMRKGKLTPTGLSMSGVRTLRTKPKTYLDIRNPRHQVALYVNVFGAPGELPAARLTGAKRRQEWEYHGGN